MKLVYLPVNAAWAFLFGDNPTRMGDFKMFFDTREEATAAAEHQGLIVDDDGKVRVPSAGGMLNGLSDLEAHPTRDQLLRDTARGIAQVILSSFSTEESARGLISVIAEKGYAITTLSVGSPPEARSLTEELGLPENIEFLLVFNPVDAHGRIAGFGVRKESMAIGTEAGEDDPDAVLFLNVLPVNAQSVARRDPFTLWRYILRVLDKRPDILIHEITHMLDHFRADNLLLRVEPEYASKDIQDEKEARSLYINNPIEFNAHFQQGAFALREAIEDMGPSARRRTFSSFREYTLVADQVEGIRNLREYVHGKWKRKLDVRLWQTWEFWKGQE